MSRTIHLSMSEGEVVEHCRKHVVGISSIEPLVSGGVRLVTMSVDGAAIIRSKLKNRVIAGEVIRTPSFMRAGRR